MESKVKLKYIYVFILLFFLGFAQSRTIPVSNAAEISQELATLLPGDTLLMKNGYWTNQTIEFKAQGSAQKPIVLKAQTPGKVWITGRSNLRIGGQYVVVDGLYFVNGYSPNGAVIEFRDASKHAAVHCRLTNSAIVDFNPPSKSTDYKWISLYGSYNRVDHCYLAGKNHQGTTLVVWLSTKPNYHRIDHNYFGHRPELGNNGGETIRIGTSDYSQYDSYTMVEWNYFRQCDGEIEIISNKSCKNTYRYNTFESCKGTLTLRHGNSCDVYANFFLGHHVDRSGGVRIIGEDHRVYNNYFQDLQGTGLRAALSLMNGVPNSPLNRYFQVKRAQVLFNTIVHCYEPLVIGAGADDEKTLPPKDCIIANNTILSSDYHPIVTFEVQPVNMTWEGNIFYGPEPGFDNIPGIRLQDPLLQLAGDSLYRPLPGSPLISAAQDTFSFVTHDMDGQLRTEPKDVGADQISTDSVTVYPLKAGDVGPDWFPPQAPPVPVIQVKAGRDSLSAALQRANDGDIVELITGGGVYALTAPLKIDKHITIRGKSGLDSMPRIMPDTAIDTLHSLFRWAAAKRLVLKNLIVDARNKSKYVFENSLRHVQLQCDSVTFLNSAVDTSGALFWAHAGSLIDTLRFENTLFYHGRGKLIVSDREAENSGLFDVADLEMKNCTVWDYASTIIDVYAGDDIPFTPCPEIRVNHCTFYRCAHTEGSVIDARQVDFTWIENSVFSQCARGGTAVKLYGQAASIDYCDLYLSGTIAVQRQAQIGSHIWQLDPLFLDPEQGNFELQKSSPLWGKANDHYALGDLRWSGQIMGVREKEDVRFVPQRLLLSNYPNPFNSRTTIQFSSPLTGNARWRIYDVRGNLLEQGELFLRRGRIAHWIWNAGHRASGMYYLQVKIQGRYFTRKLILLR